MNVAIITARTGSPGQPDKNMYPVNGVPLISYPIRAAVKSRLIDKVYISTDAPEIAAFGRSQGAETIDRPDSLLKPDVNHGDVIRHAVQTVNETVSALENVVVLLGNSVMADSSLIDQGLKMLDDRPEIDSCMTVWQAGNDHPDRAMNLVDGFLHPFGDSSKSISTEREAYLPAYYFDQGAWILRKDCVNSRQGPGPWWWMGEQCVPIVRPWIQGRDVRTYFDLALAEWWVQNQAKISSILGSEVGPAKNQGL